MDWYNGLPILAPILLTVLVYLWAILAGCLHVFKWRSLRMGIMGLFCFYLAEWAIGKGVLAGAFLPSILFFLLWTIPYSWVRGHTSTLENKEYSRLKGEYLTGVSGAVLLMILSSLGVFGHLSLWSVIIWFTIMYSAVAACMYIIYFLIYHNIFQAADMLPILLTNREEAGAFLEGQVGKFIIFRSVVALILIGFVTAYTIYSAGTDVYKGVWYGKTIISLLSLGILVHYNLDCFPLREWKEARNQIREMKDTGKKHAESLKNFTYKLSENPVGTVILIIGESANRKHMKAFNEDYPEETTPFESKAKESRNYFFFSHAYSCFTQTAQVLAQLLTGMNQYNHVSSNHLITIIDAAKASGMDTWWLSNHGNNDFMTEYIAKSADHVCWTSQPQGDDYQLVKMLKYVPERGSHFVVIHVMGSHLRYEDRVPEKFSYLMTDETNSRISAYDTSIVYTDHILSEIMDEATKRLHASAVLYVSDHGEDMKYTHGTGRFTLDMVRVPLWIYLSDSYISKYPRVFRELNAHKNSVFTNDLIFDTLCGIMHIPNSAYSKQYDLTNDEYSLSWEEATTMHGKVFIKQKNTTR